MRIQMNVDYIISEDGTGLLKIDLERLSLESFITSELLTLQEEGPKNKEKIAFFVGHRKILVSYDEGNAQTDFDKSNLATELLKGVEKTIEQAQKYRDLIQKKGIGPAREFNVSNNELPAKAAEVLSKLEQGDIKLEAGETSVNLSKMPKIGKHTNSCKEGSLKSCRVNKPEYIKAVSATFCSEVDNKKFTATLAIPDEYKQKVWDAGYHQMKVDIEFEYLEGLKQPREFKGTLTSISASKGIDTNLELDV